MTTPLLLGVATASGLSVDFEEFSEPPYSLGPETYYNGSDGAGGFHSQGVFFNNTFTDYGGGFYAWSGWSVSNTTDTTTPGYLNQYSAFPGGGAGGSAFYAVAWESQSGDAYLELPPGTSVEAMRVTNTTYAALSMLYGDSFAKKFGGPTGEDPDWFKVIVTGLDEHNAPIGQVEFYLADYRFADHTLDYVLDEWMLVDLTSLSAARKLSFGLESSDVGGFGMNTPAYFAMDRLVFVPEPGSALAVWLGGMALLVRRRRRKEESPRSSPRRGCWNQAQGESAAADEPWVGQPTRRQPPNGGDGNHPARFVPNSIMTILFSLGSWLALAGSAPAQSPFATSVIEYAPAPGQFVNDANFNDATKALGRPYGGGFSEPGNSSLVTLGGFGGTIVLGFDHTVRDDPANPFGLDAIVYGNAYWVGGNPNRRWAECGVLEISRDVNGNGLPDDPWYLIPGSHLSDPVSQYEVQTWDDAIEDPTYPPDDEWWLPPGATGTWTTEGYRLPSAIFDAIIIENPNGPNATQEGILGYADYSPTNSLPSGETAEAFYTRPDHPFAVGLTPGCGGGDGFDIAWAVVPATGAPAELDGFDFIRITTAVNYVDALFGEKSTEIDAVADVAEGRFGDAEADGDLDLNDYAVFQQCIAGPGAAAPTSPCRVMDFDQDGDVDLFDCARFQADFTGA